MTQNINTEIKLRKIFNLPVKLKTSQEIEIYVELNKPEDVKSENS